MGRIIVIEGLDGAGKETQARLLVKVLASSKLISFPRYGTVVGRLIRHYLNGKMYDPTKVSPYIASLLYTLDRFLYSFEARKLLKEDYTIVFDRYIGSNLAFQGAKIRDKRSRLRFYSILQYIEYTILGISKPDITIFLSVDEEFTADLLSGRGEKDGHESNAEFQKRAFDCYRELASLLGWKTIECTKDGKLLSVDAIKGLIHQALEEK